MKPDDIPEDVMTLAEDAYLDAVVMTTHDEPKAMVIMLARAILAERERCANIQPVPAIELPGGIYGLAAIDAYWKGVKAARYAISSTILRSAETKKPGAVMASGSVSVSSPE